VEIIAYNAKESFGRMADLTPPEFWLKLHSINDGNNELKFGLVKLYVWSNG